MKKVFFLFQALFCTFFLTAQTYIPTAYWRCENEPVISIEDIETDDYHLDKRGTRASAVLSNSDPIVGNYHQFDDNNAYYTCEEGPVLSNKRSIEFLFRPHEIVEPFLFFFSGFTIEIDYNFILVQAKIDDIDGGIHKINKVYRYNGYGRKSYNYLMDGNWHHIAVTANIETLAFELYIDGVRPPDGLAIMETAADGYVPTGDENFKIETEDPIRFGSGDHDHQFNGDVDEIAVYTDVLPATLIYRHYERAFLGYPYDYEDPGGWLTAMLPYQELDDDEYAPDMDPLQQLSDYPVPRYYPSHTLLPNTNWLQNNLMMSESGVDPDNYPRTKFLNHQLAHNFNYYITFDNIGTRGPSRAGEVDGSPGPNLHGYNQVLVDFANSHPEYPVFLKTVWSKIRSSATYIDEDPMDGYNDYPEYGFNVGEFAHCSRLAINLESNYNPAVEDVYLREGMNADLGAYRNDNKRISPAGSIYEDLARFDGNITFFLQINPILDALERPLDFIGENNEAVNPLFGGAYKNWIGDLDDIEGDFEAKTEILDDFGGNATAYLGNFKNLLNKAYFDAIQNQMMANYPDIGTYTNYSAYHVCSREPVIFEYKRARHGQPQINGRYYSTPAFYPVNSGAWRSQPIGPYATMPTLLEGRKVEMELGPEESLFSPFVSPGWNTLPEENIRPGQYLGILKLLGATGAEFYHAFHEYNAANPAKMEAPKDFVWNAAMPSYAQAITSRFEPFLRFGYLMEGNGIVHTSGDGSDHTNLPFDFVSNGGDDKLPMDPNMITFIRKMNSENKYLITTTIQRNYNIEGNSPVEKTNTIVLDNRSIRFNSRRQGSVYVYDLTIPMMPRFYQLDKWHEHTHPSFWSDEFDYEAEVYDNDSPDHFMIITEGITIDDGIIDFTNHRSYIWFYDHHSNATPADRAIALSHAAHYYFQPRVLPGYEHFQVEITLKSNSSIPAEENQVMVFLEDEYLGDIDAGESTWHSSSVFALPEPLSVDEFTSYKLSFVPKNNLILIDHFKVSQSMYLYASVINNSGAVLVDWKNTAPDQGFWLEKSIDGIDFKRIDYIENGKIITKHIDSDVLKGKTYYYRAVFIDREKNDMEGTVVSQSVSNTASAKIPNSEKEEVWLNPNPANAFTIISIRSEEEEDAKLIVYNASGELVSEKNISLVKGENRFKINTLNYSKGVYMIHVEKENYSITKKMVVN